MPDISIYYTVLLKTPINSLQYVIVPYAIGGSLKNQARNDNRVYGAMVQGCLHCGRSLACEGKEVSPGTGSAIRRHPPSFEADIDTSWQL